MKLGIQGLEALSFRVRDGSTVSLAQGGWGHATQQRGTRETEVFPLCLGSNPSHTIRFPTLTL